MLNVINNEKLEHILTKLWAEFLDYRKVIAFVMTCVRDNKNDFPVFEEDSLPQKTVEIALSRFTLKSDGFILWIDFTVPQETGFVIGTCETYLTNTGELKLNRILGQLLIPR